MQKKAATVIIPETYLYDTEVVARWSHKISVQTLRNWRCKGKGPGYTKHTGRILYRLSEIEKWEKQHYSLSK